MASLFEPRFNEIHYTLFISVQQDINEEIKSLYHKKSDEHNADILRNSHPDSGFDVFVPEEHIMPANKTTKIDLKIKCEMVKHVNGNQVPSPFYLYPRSSISKSNFRLANNVGIIDSGYRGCLAGMFDVVHTTDNVKCSKGTRLLQICSPTLEPFKVILVNNDNELTSTTRGDGGFGSTGLTN